MYLGLKARYGCYRGPIITEVWKPVRSDSFEPIITLNASDFRGLIGSFDESGPDSCFITCPHPSYGGESWGRAYRMVPKGKKFGGHVIVLIPHGRQWHQLPTILFFGPLPIDFVTNVAKRIRKVITKSQK